MATKRLLLAVILGLAACVAATSPWGTVTTPTAGPSQAIGSYTNGCLAGAQALPMDGEGYQVMRPSRARYYGHPELLQYIESLARQLAAQHMYLLVGDMAQPRGGPFVTGHASHQLGLEADLWYSHPLEAEAQSLSPQAREEVSAVSLVQGDYVDPANWSTYYKDMLRIAASDARVERIFVNPAIKRALCESDKGAPWLHKLRPWWGHDDHFHVRLKCPAGERSCVSTGDTIPAGDGCDHTLDWWFSDEAKTPREASHAAPAVMPDACRAVLNQP